METKIKCGNCQSYHATVADVRQCCSGGAAKPTPPPMPAYKSNGNGNGNGKYKTVVHRDAEPTAAQIDYLKQLGGDWQLATTKTRSEVSTLIQAAKRAKENMTQPAEPTKPRVYTRGHDTSKIPIEFLEGLRDGRFAASLDANEPLKFFKVTRPKSGEYAGTIKYSSQHGPEWKVCLVVYPDHSIRWYRREYEDTIFIACIDPTGTGIAYGQALGVCCICGKELTDHRSRWYGIGPDCETRHGNIIHQVDAFKGQYVPGFEE